MERAGCCRRPRLRRRGSSRTLRWWRSPRRRRGATSASRPGPAAPYPVRPSRVRRCGRGSRRVGSGALDRSPSAGRAGPIRRSPRHSRRRSGVRCRKSPVEPRVNNSFRLTVGGTSARSDSPSGRIRIRIRIETMRPDPECIGHSTGGIEPVSRNLPPPRPSSTARRTRSQLGGYRCHSSMRTGGGPSTIRRGVASKAVSSTGSSKRRTVFARRSAVTVFPTPFGPSKEMAGRPGSNSSSSMSTTRRK